ncbi:MAG TPA: family 10 glycosylhydrolase [Longimicrobium sp.]|nr:family 10 glycosylhydrolase [Longimicrobium sp.]
MAPARAGQSAQADFVCSLRRIHSLCAAAALLFTMVLGGCAANLPATASRPASPPTAVTVVTEADTLPYLPDVRREFRGVWVATVDNIDWPSRPGLPADSQRAELVAILDRAVQLNLNAIVLQVRPAADALYPSQLEPWSEYLTGQAGAPPSDGYDPLRFAVEESHRRGLELHAWFNPYRARHPSAETEHSAEHISRARPDLVRPYGRGQLWMDPGEPEVRAHSLAVVLDVVRRYDIDGVHLDDYFYPYPEQDSARQNIDFPDEPSWQRYVAGGGTMSRSDWRRENVNTLIRELYAGIHREKPWVKFGISPFGWWRTNYPQGVGNGFEQHEALYADARKWIREGWVDYYTPQLYWAISRPDLPYPVLLRWWVEQNVHGRHMWPGNFTSRVPREWRAEEITDQVWVTRGIPGATGNVHFSMRAFMQNPDSLNERLLRGPYRERALIPATPWLGGRVLAAPRVSVQTGQGWARYPVRMEPAPGAEPMWWIVRVRRGTAWTVDVIPGAQRTYDIDAPAAGQPAPAVVVVTPVDRLGMEGTPAYVPVMM